MLKLVLYALIAVVAAFAVAYWFGPRTPVDTTVSFDPALIGDDVETYLAESEAAVPGIRGGLAKQIVWADPQSRAKTPLAIVYIHGFSASSGELRPLPDIVARDLGANLFFTRLVGHGRSGDALTEASVNDWIGDLAEAIAVGRRIGERVVLMGGSTGATLVTWGAAQPALMEDVAALVQISANYGVAAPGSWILTLPWGRQLAELLIGERRGFEPRNDLHERYWTSDYPTAALMPMAALVGLAQDVDVGAITVPSLFIHSPRDGVIRPDRIEAIAARWGAPVEIERIATSGDPLNHVIAGDALSPQTTDAVAATIVAYLRGLASRENR